MKKIFSQKEYLVIFIFAIVKMAILVITNINSGFDGDEVMHIDAGNHLAWGYMSFQPLIGLLAWIQNLFESNSIFVHHMFSYLAALLITVYSGLTVIKLGGGWKAVLIALICIVVAPGFSVSNNIFTPLVFEQLFWITSFYVLVSYCKEHKSKYLIYMAILLGIGFMSKVSILILITGIAVSILVYKRELFAQKAFWIAILVFIVIISTNVYWQYQHDFPSFHHITALYQKTLVKLDFIDNLKLLFLTTNPFTAIVWLTALLFAPFVALTKDVRMAVVALVCSFLILLLFKGQFHYFFPAVLISYCVGGFIIESYFKATKVLFLSYSSVLLISGVFLTLFYTPILPLDNYIKYMNLDNKDSGKSAQMFFTQQSISDNKTLNTDDRIPISFEAYYTHDDWGNLTESVNEIYQQLPEYKKQNCLIWTRCYTQAAGLNLYGKKYHIPVSFTQHANYYEWIPEFNEGTTVIVVANSYSPVDSVGTGSFFASAFEKLTWKKAVFCPYARDKYNAYYMIYIGENIRYNSYGLKREYKDYIYE